MVMMHIWKSEVRDYEVDGQKIVNNANYLHYFDYARVKFFNDNYIGLVEWEQRGYIFVLRHTDISFIKPLYRGAKFEVLTKASIEGKAKIRFDQTIIYEEGGEYTRAKSIVVCVKTSNGKPCFPDELKSMFCGID